MFATLLVLGRRRQETRQGASLCPHDDNDFSFYLSSCWRATCCTWIYNNLNVTKGNCARKNGNQSFLHSLTTCPIACHGEFISPNAQILNKYGVSQTFRLYYCKSAEWFCFCIRFDAISVSSRCFFGSSFATSFDSFLLGWLFRFIEKSSSTLLNKDNTAITAISLFHLGDLGVIRPFEQYLRANCGPFINARLFALRSIPEKTGSFSNVSIFFCPVCLVFHICMKQKNT